MTGAPQLSEIEGPSAPAAKPAEATAPTAVQRWMTGMVVVVLLAWPVARWLAGRGGGFLAAGPSPASAVAAPSTAAAHLALALEHFRAGRFQDCVDAAAKAVELEPGLAPAHNDMGACYGAMGKYDEEIAAVRRALELQPDFPLARNNLAWALAQKNR